MSKKLKHFDLQLVRWADGTFHLYTTVTLPGWDEPETVNIPLDDDALYRLYRFIKFMTDDIRGEYSRSVHWTGAIDQIEV